MAATFRLALVSDTNSIEDRNGLSPWQLRHRDASRGLPRPTHAVTQHDPRRGKPGTARQTAEHRPAFRRAIKWRTGCEGRISTLKRGYGWDRTRTDGTE